MTSPDSGPTPAAHQNPSLSEDDLVEVSHEGSSDDGEDDSPKPEPEPQSESNPEEPKPERKTTNPGDPAYVAPIPAIPPISPISPVSQPPPLSGTAPASIRPTLIPDFLVGKTVDEAGDIADPATGRVLARAGGDLPSIIGREVSNTRGEILGDEGEVLGWVADVEIEREGSGPPISPNAMAGMRSLAELMGRANASLMVDHLGNILDAQGNVVGKFHDNNNPAHRKEREESERAKDAALKAAAERAVRRAAATQDAERKAAEDEAAGEEGGKEEGRTPTPRLPGGGEEDGHDPECNCSKKQKQSGRRTEEERRENAAAWRKEKPGESPSDIFLDVKSTTEGIQLTIRIPTVFNGQQVRPTVQFS